MASIVKKELKDSSLPELRDFVVDIENMSLGEGNDPQKMSKREMQARLAELGYTHIYVSTAPVIPEVFDTHGFEIVQSMNHIGLTPEDERWFLIRIHNDKNLNGKSKNVPVPVKFNDDLGYIPRGVPVWVRGRFVDSLNDAVEWHTTQSDPSKRYAESADRQMQKRYPYETLAVAGLVDEGPPPVEEGQQLVANDRNLRAARQRMDAQYQRGTADQKRVLRAQALN